ncbi:MAG TPA: hypothetical protein VHH09_03810 [Acidimicrobiales bacterium]|nr:hypothetical protein [Acidimicrobiales bacterium]
MGTRMRLVVTALVATLGATGVTACGDEDEVSVSPASTGPSAPATVSVPPDTAAPATSPASPETPPPDRGGTAVLPGADRNPKTSSVHQGSPVLLGVRTGRHPGYTRYVFDFTNDDLEGHSPLGSARPGWDVRYVPPSEAVQEGSGDPPPVGGAVYLRIRFDGAAAHYEDGSSSIRYGLDAHSPLGFGGDFEGRVTWFLGLEREQPFKVSFVENNKVVVDVVDG